MQASHTDGRTYRENLATRAGKAHLFKYLKWISQLLVSVYVICASVRLISVYRRLLLSGGGP